MDVQLHFPDGTLSTEHQALVETLNRFLALHPANGDEDAVLRLVMELLELADVAPQPEIARAVGYSQARSLRTFKQRLEEEGLGGLFDQPITGRPAVTSQPAVERAVVQATLEAVITEHALPDDGVLAQAVNGHLAEAQEPWEVTASMVETIRLRLGIQRLLLAQQLEAANDSQSPVQEKVRLGRTKAGGAFILAILLVETGWLKLAELLPMAPHYAVTTVQWLLTAIFAIIYDVRRAFYLDDVRDIGFALITGRARPLSHSTFQHLLHAIPAEAARRFYEATARQIIRGLGAGVRRISLDGHNLPRYTKVVDVVKGKIGNTGRVLKAEEMVLAFDLDAWLWLALRVYQGAKKLSQALLEMVTELRQHRGDIKGLWRIFFDKGGYKGQNFQALSDLPDVHFYCPAVRYESNVAQWEQLTEKNFEAEPFVFTKHADLPAEQRPIYRLADTAMTVNIREKHRVVGTVELRAIVIHDPEGQTSAERWPLVILTDDHQTDARQLANEFGDHWGQEFGHRIGKHDLCLDIVPPGYRLTSRRDENGQLQREVEYDPTAFFLSSWLRCLVFNLMSLFVKRLGGKYAKMWAGTLLRKFIRRPATLYLIGNELHVVFDPFQGQDDLRPLLEELNAKRVALPWLNGLVLQFSIKEDEPLHPLAEHEQRKRLFGDG
jgi:DNA-binding Lrp family transcriptional regulator